MTARQVYEGVLIELNKVKAPSLLLEDFNYLFNKAINQYINKKYNIYDTNQQSTDDVRVLKSSAVLEPIKTPQQKIGATHNEASVSYCGNVIKPTSIFGATYDFNLPADYLHLLNCVCIYKVNKQFKCYNAGDTWQQGATRLTSDIWPQIINNFYMKPSYKKPYYYIHNINNSSIATNGEFGKNANNNFNPTTPISVDTNSQTSIQQYGTDVPANEDETVQRTSDGSTPVRINDSIQLNNESVNLPRSITLKDANGNSYQDDTVERTAGHRYGNASNVRLEIRYGKDDSVFQLQYIWVDYLKAPQHIRLTQEQIDLTQDTSQIMEFPDYVCQEIINELVMIVMENSSDPRTQTHIAVSQSIANPAQQQAQPQK